jgi:hypothetical protein
MAICFGATLIASEAEAKSCSSFATIKSYDADASTVEVKYKKGRVQKFFPRPEGTPADSSKVPGSCKSKVTKVPELVVKSSGGRLSMTQVRSNFEGKMLNDTSDSAWLGKKLEELAANETEVVIVVRPGVGKDAPLGITTIYLPITDEEKAEIKRLEDQAEEL